MLEKPLYGYFFYTAESPFWCKILEFILEILILAFIALFTYFRTMYELHIIDTYYYKYIVISDGYRVGIWNLIFKYLLIISQILGLRIFFRHIWWFIKDLHSIQQQFLLWKIIKNVTNFIQHKGTSKTRRI